MDYFAHCQQDSLTKITMISYIGMKVN